MIRNIHGIAAVAGLDGDELGYLLGKVAEIKAQLSRRGCGSSGIQVHPIRRGTGQRVVTEQPGSSADTWFVYRCADGSLYTGIAKDVSRR